MIGALRSIGVSVNPGQMHAVCTPIPKRSCATHVTPEPRNVIGAECWREEEGGGPGCRSA
eukprot:2402625-Rhodomonas_salina.1